MCAVREPPDESPSGPPLQPEEDGWTLGVPSVSSKATGRGAELTPPRIGTNRAPLCTRACLPLRLVGCTGQGGQPWAQGVSMDLGQRALMSAAVGAPWARGDLICHEMCMDLPR